MHEVYGFIYYTQCSHRNYSNKRRAACIYIVTIFDCILHRKEDDLSTTSHRRTTNLYNAIRLLSSYKHLFFLRTDVREKDLSDTWRLQNITKVTSFSSQLVRPTLHVKTCFCNRMHTFVTLFAMNLSDSFVLLKVNIQIDQPVQRMLHVFEVEMESEIEDQRSNVSEATRGHNNNRPTNN